MEAEKTIFLKNDLVALRTLLPTDLTTDYLQWLNDQEASAQNSHAYFPYTPQQLESYYTAVQQSKNVLVLAIIVLETGKHIGNLSLQSINWINRSAEYAILIGDKNSWGKGYAYEASTLLIEHGFKNLNLHRIYCGTTAENFGMQKLASKLNMKEEGRRREAFFKDGKFQDILEYGVLRSEYYG